MKRVPITGADLKTRNTIPNLKSSFIDERKVTSKESSSSIEGDAFHDPMLQVLLYHFWEIPLQRIFPQKNANNKITNLPQNINAERSEKREKGEKKPTNNWDVHRAEAPQLRELKLLGLDQGLL